MKIKKKAKYFLPGCHYFFYTSTFHVADNSIFFRAYVCIKEFALRRFCSDWALTFETK